ncbi:MAG: GerAB/ArcD/ProY family transporter [Bacillota bacterium]
MTPENGGKGIRDGHIGLLEATAMMTVFAITKTFLAGPERMAKGGETAAWAVSLISGALSILWLWPLVTVLKAYPGKDLIGITRELAGKTVSLILGAVGSIVALGLVAVFVSELSDALSGVVLPKTPLMITQILMFTVALFCAGHGLEVMGRLSVVGALVVTISILGLAIASMNHWDWDSIFPLLGPGALNLAKVSLVRQTGYLEIFSLAIIAPFIRRKQDVSGSAWWALAVSAVVLCLSVLTCQMIFPFPSLSSVQIPFLRVARIVYINRFLQRFDVLFVLMWLTAGVWSIGFGIWVASVGLASSLSMNTYKPLLLPVGAAAFVATSLTPNVSTAIILEYDIIRPCSIVVLYLWPYLVLALHLIKTKNKSARSGNWEKGDPR